MKTSFQSACLLLAACTICHTSTFASEPVKTHPHPVPVHPQAILPGHPAGKPLNNLGENPDTASAESTTLPPKLAGAGARPGATLAAKPSAAVPVSAYQRRHHWRHYPVNINIYIRPEVVIINQFSLHYSELQSEAETLRAAYLALSRADRDYDGHRFYAMRETAITGNLLGVYLRGDGSGDETQEASDAQLGVARELLGQVYDGLSAKGYDDIASHVDQAIQQISAGLDDN